MAVVGAGILGLAHALAAAKRGKRVVVLDRDARANGASIRNFGFVTVTGQAAGDCWQLARRSRDIWAEVAEAAGVEILHRGLVVTARRPEAEAVIDAFLATDMGADCFRLSAADAADYLPFLNRQMVTAGLYSPHELRVESKSALPRIAYWLERTWPVEFRWSTAVHRIEAPRLDTTSGPIEAETVIVCPGDDFSSLFADRLAAYDLTRCKLQMLRIKPERAIELCSAVMSDLGLARYRGYAGLAEARALIERLQDEQPLHRANGVHLIAVQSADGSLVVGDSHQYGQTLDPFLSHDVNSLILGELEAVLSFGAYQTAEQWCGTYASADGRWRLTDAPDDATRVVIVTAGCGASTAFAIGEETLSDLFGE